MDTRTRVIATVGPACDDAGILDGLIAEGVDVFRLNFSHGTHAEHKARIDAIKRAREKSGSSCAILLDTKGPEIRTGTLPNGLPLELREGDTLVLESQQDASQPFADKLLSDELLSDESTADPTTSERTFRVAQSYPDLHLHVSPGVQILLDDGKVELTVKAASEGKIVCRVDNTAALGERKSLNIPGISLPFPTLSPNDKDDLLFGIEQGVDFVAASFVCSAEAVHEIRTFLYENGGEGIGIIAKIENRQAIDDIEAIIRASDGIMVARGDLGVEMPAHEVPHLQKQIIAKCNRAHRPVITATQMLESMTENPRPTRAETADVANAIYDGTDCVMLSGETAMGKYPVETVRTMAQIINSTERHIFEEGGWRLRDDDSVKSVSHAVGAAAVQTAEAIKAKCLVCPTMTGRTARLMSTLRPPMPIYAVAPSERVVRQMQILWGVISFLGDVKGSMRSVIANARDVIASKGLIQVGDVAVMTCGDRFTSPIARDANGCIEKFAPANVMYVVQMRPADVVEALDSGKDGALMSYQFFNLNQSSCH